MPSGHKVAVTPELHVNLTDAFRQEMANIFFKVYLPPVAKAAKKQVDITIKGFQDLYPLPAEHSWIYKDLAEAIYWTVCHGAYTKKSGFEHAEYIESMDDLTDIARQAIDWSKVDFKDIFGEEPTTQELQDMPASVITKLFKGRHNAELSIDAIQHNQEYFGKKVLFVRGGNHEPYLEAHDVVLASGMSDKDITLYDMSYISREEQLKVSDGIRYTVKLIKETVFLLHEGGEDAERLKSVDDPSELIKEIFSLLPIDRFANAEKYREEEQAYALQSQVLRTLIYDIVQSWTPELHDRIKGFVNDMIKDEHSTFRHNLDVCFG